ncbi:MAG: hypothetical protein ACR2NW_06470 [Thermodesulfobacteriota bacterium]
MGDNNQLYWVEKNLDIIMEPILEVGSRDRGNTPDYKSFFPNMN